MKKFLSLFCFGTSLLFAYSTWDVGTADYLAERGVIKDFRHNVSGYRLDATISRQEVVGIAMKMASQSQPQEYVCQNHFTDVRFPPNHTDAWVCASVEWASGRGIVSRENTRFRPKDSITKAEALAILMQAYGINITKNVDTGFNDMPVISLYRPQTPQWQIDLIESAHVNGIIDAYTDTLWPDQAFQPNKIATRAEVFGFAFQILEGKWINGITQDLHNGLTQYTSGHRDFVVTYPTTLIVREEETDINEVTQLAVSSWGTAPGGSGNIYLEIGRLDCGSCLSDYASFYNEVKKNIAAQGYVTTDISDKVMEFTREQGYSVNPIPMHGYIVTIQEGKMVYLIEVATESTSWEANKSTIHQIMASFQTR